MPAISHGPNPAAPYPFPGQERVGFLKPLVDDPTIEIGDYSYYDDPDGPEHFVARCVRHHYPHTGEKLIIGRFCAIATGASFIMSGANHRLDGLSTYPFSIFGQGWEEREGASPWNSTLRGDTVVGSDVWIGTEAAILPGVTIGSGAVIGAKAVVGRDVPPYAIAVGNPVQIVKMRFSEGDVARLLAVAWWDWPVDKLTRNLDAVRGQDIDALERAT